jgi:hypothetical protein
MLFGLMLGVWSMPSLAQDTPDEAATEAVVEGEASTEAAEAVVGDEATTEAAEDAAPLEDAELAEAELVDPESPWSTGLITSVTALIIGGFSAVLGIWIDRDKSRPLVFAVVMSILITTAIGVGATQSYLDAVDAIQQKEDLDRMLNMVGEIAVSSGDESLAALVKAEGGGDVIMPPAEAAQEEPAEAAQEEPAEAAQEEPAEAPENTAADADNQ